MIIGISSILIKKIIGISSISCNLGAKLSFLPVCLYENISALMCHNQTITEQDVWQGTQLLAIDVSASMGLLSRVLVGDELTEKEKKAFRRTMTDLASVVPIGVLMLLPVSSNEIFPS